MFIRSNTFFEFVTRRTPCLSARGQSAPEGSNLLTNSNIDISNNDIAIDIITKLFNRGTLATTSIASFLYDGLLLCFPHTPVCISSRAVRPGGERHSRAGI